MKKDFFPQKPDNNPKIYAYTENTPEYKDLIKIGYTARSLDERMKEHYPTKGPNNIKRYEVLLLDSPIISHLMQKLETSNDKVKFTRVDADHIDNLIKKDDTIISKLSDEEKEKLKPMIENAVPKQTYTVQLEAMDSNASPFIITVPEFMRRMKEMSASGGGGMMGMGNLPEMYNLIVNTNHELVGEILNTKTAKKRDRLISQSFDLAKLSQNLLHGEELTNFIKRSYDLIK